MGMNFEQLQFVLGDDMPDEEFTVDHIPLGNYDDDGKPLVNEMPTDPTDVPKSFVKGQ